MVALAPTLVLAVFAIAQAVLPVSAMPSLSAVSQPTGDARPMTLMLPHALGKGETAWLLVKVGAIGRQQIQLTTEDGRPLGTISPLGVRSGNAAGTYTIPVAPEAFDHRRLVLRVSVLQSGRAQRAPTTNEVKSIRLVIRRFKSGS